MATKFSKRRKDGQKNINSNTKHTQINEIEDGQKSALMREGGQGGRGLQGFAMFIFAAIFLNTMVGQFSEMEEEVGRSVILIGK